MIAIKVLTNYPGGNAAITGRGKGGVWNYFETLKVHFHEDIEYFSVGSRTSTEKAIPAIKRMLKDYVYFYLKLKNGQHELVHLNPSLNAKAVVRDGIFLIIAKFLQKKTIVFMHGWDPAFEKRIQGRRMGEYNRNYANQRFAASQVAQRIFDIYEEVTSGPNTMEK